MKKILLAASVIFGIAGSHAQNNNTHQSFASCTTSGYTFNGISDCIVDGSNFIGLCTTNDGTSNGAAIVKVDRDNGTTISGKTYINSSSPAIGGQRILSIGSYYYMLAGYGSGTALLKINASTGAVVFSEYIGTGRLCLARPYQPVDMVYDGSAYLYITGNVANTTNDIWVAKIDLNGAYQWLNQYVTDNYDENAQNIFYQNDTSIYIGGISDSVTAIKTKGLMMNIDNNGSLRNAKTIIYNIGGNPRMISFNLVRSGSNLYAIGLSIIGADGIGPMLIDKLDLNMNNITPRVFSSDQDNFWFQGGASKVYINNSHLIIPGVGLSNLYPTHYVNTFFSLTPAFLNANRLNQCILNNSVAARSICTYPYPTSSDGFLYTFAQDNNTSNGVYYAKGSKDFDYTDGNSAPCDTTYTFTTDTPTVTITAYTFTVTEQSNKVCGFSATVNTPSFTYTNNCSYCPSCQKVAAPVTGLAETPVITAGIKVSPNPNNGSFSITANKTLSDVTLEVIDVLGKTVLTKRYDSLQNEQVDVSSLNNGIYYIRVKDGSGFDEMRKIIKQ